MPWFAKRIAFLGAINQSIGFSDEENRTASKSVIRQPPTGEVGGRLTNGNRSIRDATGPNGNRSILDATPHGNRSAGPNENRSVLDLNTFGPNY